MGWRHSAAAVAAVLALAACAPAQPPVPRARPRVTARHSRAAPAPSPLAARSPTAPPTAPPAAFTATISGPLTAADLPHSWHPGCPEPPQELRRVEVSFVGFDGRVHQGAVVVNVEVAAAVVGVFHQLFDARFPIRHLEPVDAFGGSDAASTAADNTAGYNCRAAVAPGPPTWSMHAYGEAIDVNPVENPYLEPGQPVQPAAGAAYVNRADHRPGMAYPGGVLVDAFTAAGWHWGGYWSAPDYQHFSVNGH